MSRYIAESDSSQEGSAECCGVDQCMVTSVHSYNDHGCWVVHVMIEFHVSVHAQDNMWGSIQANRSTEEMTVYSSFFIYTKWLR